MKAPQVQPAPTDDLVESFAAVLMKLHLEHRGSFGINLVRQFAEAVTVETTRYRSKPLATHAELTKIADDANNAIARAYRLQSVKAYLPPKER